MKDAPRTLGTLVVALLLGPSLALGQSTAHDESAGHGLSAAHDGSLHTFIDSLSDAGQRFSDVQTAIAEGYRKLGPDFPGMGEHWVHPGLVISGRIDPRRPPVIAYSEIDGKRLLLGFAYTRVLGPGEGVAESVFPPGAWHDHSDGVDEESLLLSGPASMHASGNDFRLSMVHVWTGLENPDGPLAQNNWALPFLRLGLAPPDAVSPTAARALSLAGDAGLAFYHRLLREGLGMEPPHLDAVMEVLRSAGAEAGAWASAHRGRALTTADLEGLESVWRAAWARLDAELPDAVLEPMRGLSGS